MTTETQLKELVKYSQDIIDVLDDILDILSITKLVVSFNLALEPEVIAAEKLHVPPSITCYKGQSFGNLPIPVRSGWEFMGWYMFYSKNSDTGVETYSNEVIYSDEVISQGKITLYAKWERERHKVYLDPGESGTLTDGEYETEYETGEPYVEIRLSSYFKNIPNGSMGGREFQRWMICYPNGDEYEALSTKILTTEMLDENGYAHLTAEYSNTITQVSAYYIYGTYINNASSANTSPISAKFDVEMNMLHNVEAEWAADLRKKDLYLVPGHTFAGLALTKYCTSRDEAEKTFTPFGPVKMYAVWEPQTYEIRYYGSRHKSYSTYVNPNTLLKIQKINAGEVDSLLEPDEVLDGVRKDKFKKWVYAKNSSSAVNENMIELISTNAYPGKPICDLCKENGYVSLYASYNDGNVHPYDTNLLSALSSDWSIVIVKDFGQPIEYSENDPIELADYRMLIFKDTRDKIPVENRLSTPLYTIHSLIPMYVNPANTRNPSARHIFSYGIDDSPKTAFSASYNITDVSKDPVKTNIVLLSDDFGTSFKYGMKMDMTSLSVVEIALDNSNNEISRTIYDYTSMTYDPISALTHKVTGDFNLSAEFRSYLSSSITSSFVFPITVWSKVVGLSVIEPEVKPILPIGKKFNKYRDLAGIKIGLIKEDHTLVKFAEDIDHNPIYTTGLNHLSVINLPEGSEILPESPKKLKFCSCDTGEYNIAYPDISCLYTIYADYNVSNNQQDPDYSESPIPWYVPVAFCGTRSLSTFISVHTGVLSDDLHNGFRKTLSSSAGISAELSGMNFIFDGNLVAFTGDLGPIPENEPEIRSRVRTWFGTAGIGGIGRVNPDNSIKPWCPKLCGDYDGWKYFRGNELVTWMLEAKNAGCIAVAMDMERNDYTTHLSSIDRFCALAHNFDLKAILVPGVYPKPESAFTGILSDTNIYPYVWIYKKLSDQTLTPERDNIKIKFSECISAINNADPDQMFIWLYSSSGKEYDNFVSTWHTNGFKRQIGVIQDMERTDGEVGVSGTVGGKKDPRTDVPVWRETAKHALSGYAESLLSGQYPFGVLLPGKYSSDNNLKILYDVYKNHLEKYPRISAEYDKFWKY